MRLAAYCRVSTGKEEQLESLENQKAFFEEFARRGGHTLVEIYADEGISGKQMKNRAQFLRMLSDAESGAFDMVVVKDISRFARNTVDFLSATRRLRLLHIEVQFLSNNQTILGNSEFVLTVFSALAQEESANLSKRVKFGKRVNAKKGRVPNLVYGYNQKDTFTLAVNPGEADVVRRVFQMYREGLGARLIAQALDGEGIPTKKGAAWSPKTIRRMLRNPLYCGLLVNNKYETTDFLTGRQERLPSSEHFLHERPAYALVSRELFGEVQRMLDERAGSAGGKGRYSGKHLFSTLIACGCCGYSFGRVGAAHSGPAKWRCAGHNQRGAAFCPNSLTLDQRELAQAITGYLSGCIRDRSAFYQAVLAQCGASVAHAPPRGPELQKQLARLEHIAQKCRDLYLNDLISTEELRERLARLDRQEAALRTQAPQGAPPGPEAVGGLLDVSGWTNACLRRLVGRIRADSGGAVEIRLKQLG